MSAATAPSRTIEISRTPSALQPVTAGRRPILPCGLAHLPRQHRLLFPRHSSYARMPASARRVRAALAAARALLLMAALARRAPPAHQPHHQGRDARPCASCVSITACAQLTFPAPPGTGAAGSGCAPLSWGAGAPLRAEGLRPRHGQPPRSRVLEAVAGAYLKCHGRRWTRGLKLGPGPQA